MQRIGLVTKLLFVALSAIVVYQILCLSAELPCLAHPVESGALQHTPGITAVDKGAYRVSVTSPTMEVAILSTEFRLRRNADYSIAFLLSEPPGGGAGSLYFDLYAGPDYDSPDQQYTVHLPRPFRNTSVREVLNSGNCPSTASLRFIFGSETRLEISRIEIHRLGGAHKALLGVLRGLLAAHFVVAAWLVLRVNRRVGHALFAAGAVLAVTALLARPVSRDLIWMSPDTVWNVPTALSILSEGNTDLDEYGPRIRDLRQWKINRIDGHDYNFHPVGMPLLSLPFVFAGTSIHHDHLNAVERFAARGMHALIVVLFFCLVAGFSGSLPACYIVTLIFGLGTTNCTLFGDALWTHEGLQLTLLATMLLLRKASPPGCEALAPLAALPLALGYMTRPTGIVFVAVFAGYVLLKHRRHFVPFLALLLLALAVFMLWSTTTFGYCLPVYHRLKGSIAPLSVVQGAAGLLFSPNRGLFVFTPLFIFSAWELVRWLRVGDAFRRTAAAGAVLFFVAVTAWPIWWGGYSYGPRLLADLNPILALALLGPVEQFRCKGPWFRGLFVLAAVFCLFVQARGLASQAPDDWNKVPASSVKYQPCGKAWDWRDMQMFHGLLPRDR